MQNDADLQQKLQRIADLEASQREHLPRPFGPYLLLSSIARGGMGEVLLARSGGGAGLESLQKHCVVKTLRPHLTDDREYVTRFLDEARVVVQLNHRNICQVFDVGLVGERYYLAMELVAGQDLRALADATGPMEPAIAVHIIAEVLEALDYAHRLADVRGAPLQLVHRDVSPQNIMVSYEGEVKLIDFGLAQSAVKVEKTSPQTVMGKLAYMSPEQLRGEPASRAIDLFAVAVVLCELVMGARFYGPLGTHETWMTAARGGHRPKGFETLDAGLRTILDRALAPDAKDRFGDALAFRSALLAWRTQKGLWADAPTLRAVMQTHFADAQRAHREQLQAVADLSITSSPSPTPSQSLARAPGLPPQGGVVLVRPQSPSGETAAVVRAGLEDPRARWPLVIAALVGLVLVVGIGVGVDLGRSASPRPVLASEGVVADPVVAVPGVAVPGVAVPGVAVPVVDPVGIEPVALVAPAVGEPAVVVAEPVDAPPATASTSRDKPKRRPPPPPSPRPAPSPAPAPAAAIAIRWDDTPPRERATLLQQRCPKLPCVNDLRARSAAWARLGVGEMKTFTTDLEACRRSCGLK